ncbi:MAG: lipid asymmetry maintenance protein MlaB [Planctomycetota bacterium]
MSEHGGEAARAIQLEREDGGASRIPLGDSIDIAGARQLQETLLEALDSHAPITIDASAVGWADTAALQLLCAFLHDAPAAGVEVRWHAPSEPFRRAVRLLDLAQALRLKEEP